MRWLLLKDLQILRRSKLVVALLVLYPVVISLLIGLALSRGPDKPPVAFLNEVPPGQGTIDLGGRRIDLTHYAGRFFGAVDPITVHSRAEAVAKVRDGDALAALIIPPGIVSRLASGVQQAQVEVIYNGDALKQSFVRSTIDAQLAKANQALSATLEQVAVHDLQLLLDGGTITTPLGDFDLLGLQRAQPMIQRAIERLPAGSPERAELAQVARFAAVAAQGLGIAKQGLSAVTRPVTVKETVISGSRTALDAFAVVLAVAISLLFIAVLLAAGMLALEREEHAFPRLVRGLVSRSGLLAEKAVLAAACAGAVSLVMLCGIGAFTGVDWSRFGLWVGALAAGGLGCAALGVALGAAAREVRAASLLALLLALPLAFLALVPSGAVAPGVYDVVRVVNAAFPFKPALQALDAAVNGSSPGLGQSAGHLVGLALAYGAVARLALRRFA